MDSKYPILALGVLTSVLYLTSFLFAKTGLIKKVFHRKLWNIVLLFAFLSMATLAILLVINVNYKLEWKSFDGIQKWHVDFGIVMSFVAIFHFLEHLSYYLNLFQPKKKAQTKNADQERIFAETKSNGLILLLGFLSTSVQVLFVRELTGLFQGNELYMGWIIGIWMFLTGAGTYWGSQQMKAKTTVISIHQLLLLISLLPFALVLILNFVKPSIFLPGVLIHPLVFALITVILLTPVCLLGGFSYALLVRLDNSHTKNFSRIYAFEALGSLVGGIVVSLLFIRWFSILQSLLLLAVAGLFFLGFTQKKNRKTTLTITSFLIILLVCFFIFPIDLKIKSLQFLNQDVLESRESYYGNITVTGNSGQYNFYENGALLFTTNNVITNEETVHYAMLQHDAPKTVLLVSGGIEGMAREVLKYPSVKQLNYIETNQQLIRMVDQYMPLPDDDRLTVIAADARKILKQSKAKYDAAIFAVAPPSSLQYNRYYTVEFLNLLKKRLNPDAVVSFGLTAAGNYQSSESEGIEAAVYHALNSVFKNVVIVPGEKDYFIASDQDVTNQIGALSKTRNIENSYVNEFYIDDLSIGQRAALIKDNISKIAIKDTDKKPLPVFYHTLRFISQFSQFKIIFLLLPVLLLLLPLFFMSPISGGMYATGFTASSIELLLIFLFQVVFGYIYSAIGLIIALFMAGLAIGAFLGKNIPPGKKSYLSAQSLLAIYALLFPLFWKIQTRNSSEFIGWILLVILILIPAALVGCQYVASTKIYGKNLEHAASVMYAADLLGGALGTVLLTLVLIPFLGINTTCYFIAAANVFVVLINFTKPK